MDGAVVWERTCSVEGEAVATTRRDITAVRAGLAVAFGHRVRRRVVVRPRYCRTLLHRDVCRAKSKVRNCHLIRRHWRPIR